VTGPRPIILALPKGRILAEAAALFGRAGYDLSPALADTRKLVIECGVVRVLVLRNSDVPTFVGHGAADVGVVGSDVLDEDGGDLYQPLDLGIGRCRMILAGRADEDPRAAAELAHLRIATKYPRTTRTYLQRRGITAEVIKLSGAIELGPLTGLCDQIVDITQTGETLRQNGLREVATVGQVSSRLVVGPARLKLDGERLAAMIDALGRAVSPPPV
jgi:ATP phosphoribosyltransferase